MKIFNGTKLAPKYGLDKNKRKSYQQSANGLLITLYIIYIPRQELLLHGVVNILYVLVFFEFFQKLLYTGLVLV